MRAGLIIGADVGLCRCLGTFSCVSSRSEVEWTRSRSRDLSLLLLPTPHILYTLVSSRSST